MRRSWRQRKRRPASSGVRPKPARSKSARCEEGRRKKWNVAQCKPSPTRSGCTHPRRFKSGQSETKTKSSRRPNEQAGDQRVASRCANRHLKQREERNGRDAFFSLTSNLQAAECPLSLVDVDVRKSILFVGIKRRPLAGVRTANSGALSPFVVANSRPATRSGRAGLRAEVAGILRSTTPLTGRSLNKSTAQRVERMFENEGMTSRSRLLLVDRNTKETNKRIPDRLVAHAFRLICAAERRV